MKTDRLLRSRSTAWALGIILIVRPGVCWISLVRFQWPSITLLLLVVAVDPLQRPDCKATLAPRWVFISMARLQQFRQFRGLMGVTEMKWLWKWEVLKTLLTKTVLLLRTTPWVCLRWVSPVRGRDLKTKAEELLKNITKFFMVTTLV
ncbi:hypothetical protein V6Z11_D07G164000 [Gossypium hirsutum]